MIDTLKNLPAGASAVIDSIRGDDVTASRLKSLGFRSGMSVQVLRSNSNCQHVRVGSTEWAIRHNDAESVKIIPREQSR